MTDRPTFDGFEQRIAAELRRYVTPANDPRPAADIADTAMQPRGVVVRVRNSSQGRRFLVLGVAAVLLLPALYLGVGGSRNVPALPAPSLPSPTVGATLAPTASIPVISPAAQGAVSIFTRRSSGSVPGVSVFAVGTDGAETLVRQIPDSVLPAPGRLGVYGSVSEFGWLALRHQDTRPSR